MKFAKYLTAFSAFSAGSIALLTVASSASAVTLELGLGIDGSGSISSSDFDLQLDGYSDAFSDPDFFSGVVEPSRFDNIAVGVYQFGGGFFSPAVEEEISFTTIENQSDADALASDILNINQNGGGTPLTDAVNTITNDINNNGIDSDRQVIDFSTDGAPNDESASIAAADDARANGIDAINSLGVGSGVDISFLEDFSDAGNTGFVVQADSFDEFDTAIEDKLGREIQEGGEAVPFEAEGTMGLVALGGFIWYRRRKKRNQAMSQESN